MAAPVVYGGLGLKGAGLGLMGLGGKQQAGQLYPLPAMPSTPLPYIAHLYSNTWQFKRTLGGARLVAGQTAGGLVTKPGLKMTLNGGFQPVTLELDAEQPPKNLVVDPGFEASNVIADVAANWAMTTPAEWALLNTPTDIHSGRRAIQCTRTNLGPNNWNTAESAVHIAVLAGQTYFASVWTKQNGGVKQGQAKITWFDSSGASISDSLIHGGVDGVLPWTYWSATVTAPSNAVTASFRVLAGWWDGVTGTNAQCWYDDARFVLGTDKSDPATNGDLIQLTEQGDPGSTVLFTGILESISDEIDGDGPGSHELVLTPLVAELADTFINIQYATLVDVAQMVRDAVLQTAHLRFTPATLGNTGVMALYNFNNTNALDVLNVAKQIAGLSFWWHVDANGMVWFQSTATTTPPDLTIKRGVDYKRRKLTPSIQYLKNFVKALGGYPGYGTPSGPNVPGPITSQYSNVASQKKYGVRAVDPPLVYPTVNDQATLDLIVNAVATTFDREQRTVEVELPNYPKRLSLAQPGGLTVRLWEPLQDPYPQPGSRGVGGYLGTFICQDIEVDGIVQKLILTDVIATGLQDIQYTLDQIVQRNAMSALASPPVLGGGIPNGGIVQIGGWQYTPTLLVARDPLGGSNRVEMGSLAAYTDGAGATSPAHWGVRTIDSNGLIVSDSVGLTNVMKQLGVSGSVSNQNFTSVSLAEITGTQVPFSVPRQTDILLNAFCTGKVTAGVNNGLWQVGIVGGATSGSVYCGVANFITQFAYLRVTLPAGSYIAHIIAGVDVAGTTYNVPGNSTVLEVIALGR